MADRRTRRVTRCAGGVCQGERVLARHCLNSARPRAAAKRETMKEEQLLLQIAQQYRQDGYTVWLRPAGNERPPFLANFDVDMIAARGNENVVVEVREAGTNGEASARLGYLASIVNAEPNWRFDVVVPGEDASRMGEERNATEIRALMAEAQQLVGLGMLEPALLVAWAALEAAMREAAKREGIPLEERNPQFVLTTIFAEGLVSREDYEIVRQTMRTRNGVAHGLKERQLSSDIPSALIQIAERLLNSQPAASA
ncbi:MAG TPA: hypothetical protein VFV87_09920 [Pirellulaceae bacterium]|nr:hypothetical protein [Pirellulaceae bacterium]